MASGRQSDIIDVLHHPNASAEGNLTVRALNKLLAILMATILSVLFLAGCSASRLGVLPVVKVGLIAPFEGPQRAAAYECLFAVKSAIKEYNEASRGIGPLVELVALDDSLSVEDADKRKVMQQMTIDPAVLGVVGPWMTESEKDTELTRGDAQEAAPPVFIFPTADHDTSSSTSRARWAYEATKTLLKAIRAAHLESELTRQQVEDRLRASR